MLHLYIGDKENSLYTPEIYFDNRFKKEWLESEFAKKVIKEIDKSDVLSSNLIDGPIGLIPPQYLSGGAKTLILLNVMDFNRFVNLNGCGENCADFLLEIANDKDLYCTIEYPMFFRKGPFKIHILNTDTEITDNSDLADMYIDFL